MSPPCDMANDGNISDVLLVRCDRDELGEWNDRIAKLKGAANPDQIKQHSEWFRKLVNQSRPGQHFLPPLPDDPRPLMVQFDSITTRPFARSAEHTSELPLQKRITYTTLCLKKQKNITNNTSIYSNI